MLFTSSTAIPFGFWKEIFSNPGPSSKGCLWKTTVWKFSDLCMDHEKSNQTSGFHTVYEEMSLGIWCFECWGLNIEQMKRRKIQSGSNQDEKVSESKVFGGWDKVHRFNAIGVSYSYRLPLAFGLGQSHMKSLSTITLERCCQCSLPNNKCWTQALLPEMDWKLCSFHM